MTLYGNDNRALTSENLCQTTLVAEHGKIVDELAMVKDLVEPCFPPHYQIFELFVGRYHALLVELVRVLMDQHSTSLMPSDIILIVNWLRDYHGQMDGLGAKATPVCMCYI